MACLAGLKLKRYECALRRSWLAAPDPAHHGSGFPRLCAGPECQRLLCFCFDQRSAFCIGGYRPECADGVDRAGVFGAGRLLCDWCLHHGTADDQAGHQLLAGLASGCAVGCSLRRAAGAACGQGQRAVSRHGHDSLWLCGGEQHRRAAQPDRRAKRHHGYCSTGARLFCSG